MSKLFPNYEVDLKKGTVYSKKFKKNLGSFNDGYYECRIKDIYGNVYTKIHQVIIAEGLNLPKHLWPVDENGRQYVTDHIKPIKDGGTDTFENLRLVTIPMNSNNPSTKLNQSKAGKNKVFTEEWRNNLSESQKKAWKDGKHTLSQSFLDGSQKYLEEQKKQVFQYSLNGELIAVYSGRNEAARETGYNRERITFHCTDGKPYKGYFWSYSPMT